jgi:hypothetical protein
LEQLTSPETPNRLESEKSGMMSTKDPKVMPWGRAYADAFNETAGAVAWSTDVSQ